MTKIKICGLTNLDDALCAAEAGADFLGFIFYDGSPRRVNQERVALITQTIRHRFGSAAPRFVGVFVNESATVVHQVMDVAGLDLAQLHGEATPEDVQGYHGRAFMAIRPRTHEEAEVTVVAHRAAFSNDKSTPQLLLDAYHPHQFGGTGLQADMDLAEALARQCRLLLAGGLLPESVGRIVHQVRPWGVDVSSGVEREKGIKDRQRVRAFIDAVRSTDTVTPQGGVAVCVR